MESTPSLFQAWFQRSFGMPTPVQTAAWPPIRLGRNVLIVSPPGTGKTFAAFFEVLDVLTAEHATAPLADEIHCIYVSPLRALGYDLTRNLQRPLEAIYGPQPPIRIGMRTGDTPATERERQRNCPPHILVTTPESLALLLSQSRWIPALSRVRWVIVDEIHSLAENKRGAHLSLSLERLDAIHSTSAGGREVPSGTMDGSIRLAQRIGLSATVHPAEEAARFLSGADRTYEIVTVAGGKRMDLKVYSPLRRNPYPPAGFGGERLMRDLARLVKENRTTLIFTNTRSGAESTTHWLKQQLPELANQVECHHASLDRDLRLDVEDRLKRGELRAVICSTSLELGIDIGSIDLVVMMSTPKGVSRALQRTGRAGHNLRDISRGLLIATNVNDLVECAATARLARHGHLDRIRIPYAPLDVLAQHLMGLGCLGEMHIDTTFALVTRAWPFRHLSRGDFNDVLEYLAGGGRSLRQQYEEVFGKIELDLERGTYEARAGAPRRDFLQNIGTIPTDGTVRILLGNSSLGTVEESFMRRLKPGDVFSLGGRALRLDRVGTMEAWVRRADGAVPTVPRWGAGKMPLSTRIGEEIVDFRGEFKDRLVQMPFSKGPSLIPWIARRLECDEENATVIFRIHAAQHQASEIPTRECLLIEEYIEGARDSGGTTLRTDSHRSTSKSTLPPRRQIANSLFSAEEWSKTKRATAEPPPVTGAHVQDVIPHHYFFHSLLGRAANDALSRVVALRLARHCPGNTIASPDDYGFVLTLGGKLTASADLWRELFNPDGFVQQLETSLARSDLLKYHFRSAAQTGLMVYRNHFGQQKPLRKLQWSTEVMFNVLADHEPDHVLMREARRDALHSFLDAQGAMSFLEEFHRRGTQVRMRQVPHVPPLSFPMFATRIREALLVEDPQETLERLYHQWWNTLEAVSPMAGSGKD